MQYLFLIRRPLTECGAAVITLGVNMDENEDPCKRKSPHEGRGTELKVERDEAWSPTGPCARWDLERTCRVN